MAPDAKPGGTADRPAHATGAEGNRKIMFDVMKKVIGIVVAVIVLEGEFGSICATFMFSAKA